MTTITVYRNNKNENKYIEVHNDGHYHNSVKEYMKWSNGVKNLLGDKRLHRWKRENLNELLKDYTKL